MNCTFSKLFPGSKRGISRATLNQVAKGLLSNVSSGSDNDQMSLDESLTYSDTGCAGDSRSGCCDSEPKSPSVLGCSDIGSNSPDYGYAANESHDGNFVAKKWLALIGA